MKPEDFDARAFEAKAASLQHALEHALARCARHLDEAAPLPLGPNRAELLSRARDALRTAREALGEREALRLAARGSGAPPSERALSEDAIERLAAKLDAAEPTTRARPVAKSP